MVAISFGILIRPSLEFPDLRKRERLPSTRQRRKSRGMAANARLVTPPKKSRPALGGELAAREPVWDGEGWGCDRVAGSIIPFSDRGCWRWRPRGGCHRVRPTHWDRPATGA